MLTTEMTEVLSLLALLVQKYKILKPPNGQDASIDSAQDGGPADSRYRLLVICYVYVTSPHTAPPL